MGRARLAIRTITDWKLFATLWSLAIISVPYLSVEHLPLLQSPYGLYNALPPATLVLIVLLAVLLAVTAFQEDTSLQTTRALMFAVLIWAVLPLAEANPRPWDAYYHYADALAIIQGGRLPTASQLFYVGNYPSAFLDYASLGLLGSLSPDQVLRLFPFVAVTFTVIAFHAIVRGLAGPRVAGRTVIFAVLISPYFQFHVSPQALGFIDALLLMETCRRRSVAASVVSILLFIFLASAHPTSVLFVIGFCISYLLIEKISGFLWHTKGTAILVGLTTAFVVTWLSWSMFYSVVVSHVVLARAWANFVNVLNAGFLFETTATERLSSALSLASTLRTIALAIETLTSAAMLTWLRGRIDSGRYMFLGALFVTPISLSAADIVLLSRGGPYPSGVLIDRFFLWLSLIFALLVGTTISVIDLYAAGTATAVTSRRFRRKIHELPRSVARRFVALSIIVALVTLPTFYYQEPLFIVSTPSRDASLFLTAHASDLLIVGGKLVPAVWTSAPMDRRYNQVQLFQQYPRPTPNGSLLVLDGHDQEWYLQWYGLSAFSYYQVESESMSLVYDSGPVKVFFH